VLYLIASGKAGFSVASGFAANGYAEHSPDKYGMTAALICELVMTFMFVIVILGTTHKRAPVGFAGLAIGLALTLIHLISIPVTNTSVNPARSTGPAVFVGGWALQLLGHVFEGRRPALVDNFFQVFIAPLFLCAEVFFALGYKPQLHTAVEQRARRLRAGT
jgi:uncharacterized membrane protein YGL010W